MIDSESESGLHIDSDWKTEAAREKERLVEQEQAAPTGGGSMGPPSFLEIIDLIVMQVAIALGAYQGPGGERMPPNASAAKHFIDMLELLELKTRGNLGEEEKQTLDAVLYQLRMQFVNAVGRVAAKDAPRA